MSPVGRHRKTCVRQELVELDSGITADAACTAAADRDTWSRALLRPTADHAVQYTNARLQLSLTIT